MKDLSRKQTLAIFLLLSLCVTAPVFLVAVPPLLDYPNHLARCSILAQLPHNSLLSAMYEPRHAILPNLAMDAIVVPLARVMPALIAGKIFCVLVLLVIFSGGVALSAAAWRRVTLWSFAPALLLYNHIYTFGFLNYLFGIGLMLWGVATWIWLRERGLLLRVAVASLLAAAMFFCHLMAVFLFGCVLIGWEVAHWLDAPDRKASTLVRDLAALATVFVLPFVLLKLSPTQAEAGVYVLDSLRNKWNVALQMLRMEPSRFDEAWSYSVLGLGAILFATRTLRFERRMRWAAGVLALAFIALPLAFATSSEVDVRVPILVGLVLFSGSQLDPQHGFARIGGSLIGVQLGLRLVQVTHLWLSYEPTIRQLVADMNLVPPHSVVLTAADRHLHVYGEACWDPPLVHVALLTAPRGVFFPQIFALPNQHPMAVKAEFSHIQHFEGSDPLPLRGAHWVDDLVQSCRQGVFAPGVLPPALGPKPQVYLLLLTTPGEQLGPYPGAELVAQRERYTLLRLLPLQPESARREHRYTVPQRLRSSADRATAF